MCLAEKYCLAQEDIDTSSAQCLPNCAGCKVAAAGTDGVGYTGGVGGSCHIVGIKACMWHGNKHCRTY